MLACEDRRAETLSLVTPAALPIPPVHVDPRTEWVQDPLFSNRRLRIRGGHGDGAGRIVGQKPPEKSVALTALDRVEKTAEERGGINPCERPDPGYGIFSRWQFRSGFGKLIIPRGRAVNAEGGFDFIAHFHGADLARMEYVRSDTPVVFLAVSGDSGGNYPTMTGRHALDFLIHDVEKTMGRESSTGKAQAEHLALAAWSGGYAAVGTVLKQSENWRRIDAIILLDGLHAAGDLPEGRPRLPHFAKFARRAMAGEAFMFLSYSSIPTEGHASTTEATHQLIEELGGYPVRAEGSGPGGMELKEAYSAGGFHARGYKGGGRLDHCAHLLLYPEVAQALHRHWHPPGAG